MTEYYNITEINCKLSDKKWKCDIVRTLSKEPTQIDNKLCYSIKTETIENIEDVHLEENAKTCFIDSLGENKNVLRCLK